jgi:hypothetical protein
MSTNTTESVLQEAELLLSRDKHRYDETIYKNISQLCKNIEVLKIMGSSLDPATETLSNLITVYKNSLSLLELRKKISTISSYILKVYCNEHEECFIKKREITDLWKSFDVESIGDDMSNRENLMKIEKFHETLDRTNFLIREWFNCHSMHVFLSFCPNEAYIPCEKGKDSKFDFNFNLHESLKELSKRYKEINIIICDLSYKVHLYSYANRDYYKQMIHPKWISLLSFFAEHGGCPDEACKKEFIKRAEFVESLMN